MYVMEKGNKYTYVNKNYFIENIYKNTKFKDIQERSSLKYSYLVISWQPRVDQTTVFNDKFPSKTTSKKFGEILA